MSELALSQTELAARCVAVSQDLFPRDTPQISRERIAKILMHCKFTPAKSAARVISPQEIRVIAAVLQVSPEWLTRDGASRDLVLWDPLAEPHRANHILHLINEHEDHAREVLVWAEFLICSLETPEFMHKHHEALFSELELLGTHDERHKLIQIYDSIGNARRKRLLSSTQKRRKLSQFIFASDLNRVTQGTGEYTDIGRELRQACLENLNKMISDRSLGIDLFIVDGKSAERLRKAFRDYDSLGVFDESFVLWRYHSGMVAWSEDTEQVKRYRKMLKALERTAERTKKIPEQTREGDLFAPRQCV